MRWLALSGLLLAFGCDSGGFAMTSGNIGEHDFNDVVSVYHGGPFLAFFDREIDCLDLAWVDKVYQEAQSPTDIDFIGLQFAWEDEPQVGAYSVAGDAAVGAWGITNIGGVFERYRGRDGSVTIDELGPVRSDAVIGRFEVTFDDGSRLNGQFETEYCRNLRAG